MSTYGTAAVIDVPTGTDVAAVRATFGPDDAWPVEGPTGWDRYLVSLVEIEQLARFEAVLQAAGQGRIAIAEDNDEFGALWVVLTADAGAVTTVHRRYILNADPTDPDEVADALTDHEGVDPRERDVAGVEAATQAAIVFGEDPAAMVTAENESTTAFEEVGVVGGPFPWWTALDLPWPER